MKSTVENLSPTRVRLAVEVPFDELKPSLDAAYKKIGAQIRVPGLPSGQGAGPDHRPAGRPRRGAARRPSTRRCRGCTPRPSASTSCSRSASPRSRSPSSTTASRSASPPRSTSAPRSRCPSSTASRSPSTTSRSPTTTSTSSSTRCASGSARSRASSARCRPATSSRSTSSRPSTARRSRAARPRACPTRSAPATWSTASTTRITGKSAGDTGDLHRHAAQGEHAGDRGRDHGDRQLGQGEGAARARRRVRPAGQRVRHRRRAARRPAHRLGRVKALEQGAQARDKVLEQLVETVEFPLPESAVQAEVDYREHDVVHSARPRRRRCSSATSRPQGKTREEFTAELRESAEKSVRAQFILDAIADATEVQVGDAELTEYLVRQAAALQHGRRRSSPTRSCRPATCRRWSPTSGATRRWPTCSRAAAITDASGNPVDLSALAAAADARSPRPTRDGCRRPTTPSDADDADRRVDDAEPTGPSRPERTAARCRAASAPSGFVRVDVTPPHVKEGRPT